MKQAPEILQKRGCESFALGTVPLALVPCKNADLDVCFCGLGAKQVADGRERQTDRQRVMEEVIKRQERISLDPVPL